jgi:hypothetical protein
MKMEARRRVKRRKNASARSLIGPPCAYCGKPKKYPKGKLYVSLGHYESDPYCSRTCMEADRKK